MQRTTMTRRPAMRPVVVHQHMCGHFDGCHDPEHRTTPCMRCLLADFNKKARPE
jgi:hypothetical protein